MLELPRCSGSLHAQTAIGLWCADTAVELLGFAVRSRSVCAHSDIKLAEGGSEEINSHGGGVKPWTLVEI